MKVTLCDACGRQSRNAPRDRWISVRAYTGDQEESSNSPFSFMHSLEPAYVHFIFCSPACVATFGNIQMVEAGE